MLQLRRWGKVGVGSHTHAEVGGRGLRVWPTRLDFHCHVGFIVGVSLFVAAPPLSVDNVVQALKALSALWRDVGDWLYIPKAAQQHIESEYSTDVECLRALVRCWLLRDPLASWRRLIHQLDLGSDFLLDFAGVADGVRAYAEELPGQQ